jgi:hypothetical protein
MTLKELYSQVRGRKSKGQLGKYQLLSRHERQLAKYVTTMGGGSIKVCIRVFESGYVLYEEDEKFTVFHLSEIVNKNMEYDTTDSTLVSRKERNIQSEALMSSEWYVRIILEGNDRIMHNREKVEADHTEFSYSGISEDMAQLGTSDDYLKEIIKEIDHQKMLEIFEVVKNSMKPIKWEIFVKIMCDGKTQVEIAPLYGKTQQAVSRHFVDAKDIIEELRDELKKLYYDD